jgi:hypothetical protein
MGTMTVQEIFEAIDNGMAEVSQKLAFGGSQPCRPLLGG